MKSIRAILRLLSPLLLFLVSCATARQLANIQKPQIDIRAVRVSDLTLESVDLVFTVGIRNPNDTSIEVSRFDYSLDINDRRFLEGDRKERITLTAHGDTSIDIPITLVFERLFSTYRNLSAQDSARYRAEIGVRIDVPLWGDVRIPVARNGSVPLLRKLKINIGRSVHGHFDGFGANLARMGEYYCSAVIWTEYASGGVYIHRTVPHSLNSESVMEYMKDCAYLLPQSPFIIRRGWFHPSSG